MPPTKTKLTRRPSKIRPVPINLMVVPAAFTSQRPFIPAHGDALANGLDLNMLGFPIVNHRDGKHWLCDGQHRVYALKKNGFTTDNLDCEVYENLTDEEMAQVFLGRDRRKAISPLVKFHIACTAGYVRENAIRRVVEANGLKIARNRSENCIAAVGALIAIYDSSPTRDTAVGWCVRVAKLAFCGDPLGFDRYVLEALGLIQNRYNGRASEKDIVAKLQSVPLGIRGLLRRAEARRDRTGQNKTACLCFEIIEAYNRGLTGRARLAPWSKETVAA